jgi:para-aminobenzoate synthetase component 1
MTTTTVHLEELPYEPDSCALFECLRQLPHALLLDSSYPHSRAGRFDILTAEPCWSLRFTEQDSGSHEQLLQRFAQLQAIHKEHFGAITAPAEDIPFCGGLAGYLAYGDGKPLQHLPAEQVPGGEVHAYEWAVIQDHLLQRCTFAAIPSVDKARRQRILELLRTPTRLPATDFSLREPFRSNLEPAQYRRAFQAIQRYILDGDCYQVNLAQCFSAGYDGDPWQAYLQLRPLAAAPYAGFMDCQDDQALMCLSPERFLGLYGRHVETRPIKGTRPRHRDPQTDEMLAQELQQSTKDRAENLMIVDLLRSDIGRSCVPGSVRVDRLFELESYPTVHHLVSTISGELLPARDAFDLLRDCFPGGSITGAPKRRAMEIIDELEPEPRRAYCGSLFYISADGRMDSNIAIRSLLCDGELIRCWGGGGIVADSDCEREYRETWDKVGKFIQALEA